MTRHIQVLDRLALMGPNLHSHQPCIKWKIDIGSLEERPSSVIPGFVERLMAKMPSLIEHRCSEGVRGGFKTRLDMGTWMGHVMEHVAIELQNLAGSRVGFGRARSADETGVYYVIYQCEERETGLSAGHLALDLIEALIDETEFQFDSRLAELRDLHARSILDPSTQVIVDAARARDIPLLRYEAGNLVQLGHGSRAKRVEGAATSLTSHLGVELAADRWRSRSILEEHGVPVSRIEICSTIEDASAAAEQLGWPLVVRGLGEGSSHDTGQRVSDETSLLEAFENAKCAHDLVVLEKEGAGALFRLLVIAGRFAAAGRLSRASSETELSSSTVDDVTRHIHPSVVATAERAASLIGLAVAGVDIVAERIDVPLEDTGGVVVRVTAAPDLSVHEGDGMPRAAGDAIVSMLFPAGSSSRIPLLSVTGTNGKTTTARLCAHIALEAGHHVGLATTDGIYIRNRHVLKGDLTGPQSARVILQDPAVNFAVLETARGGILRAGLGYDWSDVAIVTNIAEDHLGLRGVNTIEDLARVKAVTVERVRRDGYAILNAEDAMTPLMREHADCRIALFALDPQNAEFRAHREAGCLGVTVEDGEIVIHDGETHAVVDKVRNVPITFDGRAKFNISNVLAAVAAARAIGIEMDSIRSGIRTFFPSIAQTPGRTNFIEFDGFTVIIDYAHNPHGVAAMADFVRALKKKRSVATIAVPGDRRDSDIEAVARIAAAAFDVVILREDYHTRGRKRGEVAGIMRRAILETGFDESQIHVCTDELGALELGLEICQEDDLFLYFADKVEEATTLIERKRMERAGQKV